MTATDSISVASDSIRTESRATAEAQNWKLLWFFDLYRLTIALSAALMALFAEKLSPFGKHSPGLFAAVAWIYLGVVVLSLIGHRLRRPDFESQVVVIGFADVTLLVLLMHASGGLQSGLVLLVLVAVAAISIMLDKRDTIFYAALATLATLLEHSWGSLTGQIANFSEVAQGYPQVGVFGIGMFTVAFLSYTLASRLRATEDLAERRGVDLANLSHLNELIIQRMQMGVVVCDGEGNVRLTNQAAQKFLAGRSEADGNAPLSNLAPDLGIQLFQWFSGNPAERGRKMFTAQTGYSLLPRFVPLGESREAGVLIFLEDMAVLKQQASQLKMGALARLTASIAHEIRNPLGAISNAAQLLGESAKGESEESRLLKIIEEQSRRMNVIVQNVTQLARRDQVKPVRIELEPWLKEFAGQFAETGAIPREIFAQFCAPGLNTCVDPDQLHQVVANLCQNALRHSPPFTGTPLIKLQGGTDADGRPCLDVIDWGSGVPAEIMDSIFDPFFTTTPKGTGLGLYIARELCEGNGANLTYHPGDGGVGSRFRITFARAEDCAELGSI